MDAQHSLLRGSTASRGRSRYGFGAAGALQAALARAARDVSEQAREEAERGVTAAGEARGTLAAAHAETRRLEAALEEMRVRRADGSYATPEQLPRLVYEASVADHWPGSGGAASRPASRPTERAR